MNTNTISEAIPARHYWAIIFLAALWSSSFLVIKVSVVTIPPLTLTAVRLFVAMAVLWCVLIYKGELLPSCSKTWFMCLLIGFFGSIDILVDPYTSASSNLTRIRATQFCDIAVRHGQSFTKATA